jgi:SpoVK/Ycf46/Vps4 family AAA+-type ATPase
MADDQAPLTTEQYLEAEVLRLKFRARERLGALEGERPEIFEAVDEVVATERARARAEVIDESALPPLLQLAARFGLDDLEVDVLVAAIAPHVDPDVPPLYREIRGSLLAERVDAALLLHLFSDSWGDALKLRRAIGPQGALMRQRILQVAALPTGASALQAAIEIRDRVLHFALGEEGLGTLIAPFCQVEQPDVTLRSVVLPERVLAPVLELAEHHGAFAARLAEWGYDPVLTYGRGSVLLFTGPPGTGKTLLARALANHLETPLLRVFVSKVLRAEVAAEDVLDELIVEARLRRALILFDDCAALFAEAGPVLSALLAFLEEFEGIAVLATNRTDSLDIALERRVLARVDFPRPDAGARELIYEALLPADLPIAADVDLSVLADRYDFTGGNIKNVVMVALNKALARDTAQPLVDMGLLEEAAQGQLRYRLDDYAVRTEVSLDLDDIVLPPKVKEQVVELLAACRNHEAVMHGWGFGERLVTGRGIVALFDGPPGTGKTLCAEILGSELGLPVSRINIPSVVSKWVGETEQRLQDIFRRARATRTVLLFDEADALFGRRSSQAQSSNDRYANMEVNLLLQEIERYDGIVFLTTNLFGALDDALLRRIGFRISFSEPDAELRARIWETLMPKRAPLDDDVNLAALGKRFELAGGRIKNAVLRAAYRALQEGHGAIAQRHLESSAVQESSAAGKVVRIPEKS